MFSILPDASFKSTHEDWVTEIGDTKQPIFHPQIKIMKWDNEVNFSMRLEDNNLGSNTLVDNKVVYDKSDKTAKFYELEKGFEFEIILKEKPLKNILNFTLQHKGLDFHYQTIEPTQEEIDEDVFKPENVKGSYAVYHNSKVNNKYKAGKAFHIYRPFATDAKGVETWCKFLLDAKNNTATLEIPQNFLDNATYPISIDPDFGYTTAGASQATYTDCRGCRNATYQHTASSGDTITSYSLHAHSFGSSASFVISAYDTSSLIPVNRDFTETSVTFNLADGSQDWNTSAATTDSLTTSDVYAVCYLRTAGSVRVSRDSSGTSTSVDSTTGALPATWSESGTSSALISQYATYTAGGGGGNTQQINISDTWRDIAGYQINIADTWRTVAGVQINISDTWRTIF